MRHRLKIMLACWASGPGLLAVDDIFVALALGFVFSEARSEPEPPATLAPPVPTLAMRGR